jgi:acyl carrier protein
MLEINYFHICPDDRVIILRPLSSVPADTLTGLMAGETIFPIDIKGQALLSLGKFLNTEKITHFSVTPTLFRYFAQELRNGEQFPLLRMIKFGGEPLFRADVEVYKRCLLPSCIIVNRLSGNEMGPICQYWMTTDSKIDTAIVPVGYPIEGKTLVLLNDEDKEVDPGQVGEIVVTSRYLSSGYWNKSKLTNEKFPTPEAISDEQQYLSGDLGQRLSDDCLIYVGRKDDQIKIRGAKVTIGEVEAVLSEHPQIKQSAVVAIDRTNGDKYLVAYVVARGDVVPPINGLRNFLNAKLPDYMTPSVFMFLQSLPLTNGKLDRKSLPRPDRQRPNLEQPYSAPCSEIDKRLSLIWSEVLTIDQVGIHDNFFDLGGHSLAGSQLISRVIQEFQVELPIKMLFDSPTIAEMAAIIEQNRPKPASEVEMERMLGEVEAMTDEEAEAVVKQLDREAKS